MDKVGAHPVVLVGGSGRKSDIANPVKRSDKTSPTAIVHGTVIVGVFGRVVREHHC